MPNDIKIRWKWVKFMYWYTIVGAGGFGLGIILMPKVMRTLICVFIHIRAQISSQVRAGSHAAIKL